MIYALEQIIFGRNRAQYIFIYAIIQKIMTYLVVEHSFYYY